MMILKKIDILLVIIFIALISLIIKNNALEKEKKALKEQIVFINNSMLNKEIESRIFSEFFYKIENIHERKFKKTKLSENIVNCVYYIGTNTCGKCFSDAKNFLSNTSMIHENLNIYLIVDIQNIDILDYFSDNSKILIDYQGVLLKYSQYAPIKILFFNNGKILAFQFNSSDMSKEIKENFLIYANNIAKYSF